MDSEYKDTRTPPPADFARCSGAQECVISGFCKRSRPAHSDGQVHVHTRPLRGTLMPGRVPCLYFVQDDDEE